MKQVNHQTSSAKPIFATHSDQLEFNRLRKEVGEIVQRLAPRRQKEILLKAIVFPVLYVLTYLAALTYGSYLPLFYACYFLLGLELVFIFLNTIHDAVHGTLFQRKTHNRWFVCFFDLMGANSYIWQLRHVRFHHNYPNVNGWDTDIEQSKLFRVFPDGAYAGFHRYQHIYLPLLYPFYLANWLLVRDFKDFFSTRRTVRKLVDIPAREYVRLLFFKAFFLFYLIVLPIWVLGLAWWQVIAAFGLMLFTASIFSLMVLLSPHANTGADFPLPDNNNRLPYDWMMHMLKTTNDVSHNNWCTRYLMGCFNFHVAHHLFPHVNHVFYPEITQRLQQYAEEHHLPYRSCSLYQSLKSHYQLLKQNRMPENLFEETM